MDQCPRSYDSHPSMRPSLAELRQRRMEDDRRIQELEFRLQRLPAVHMLRQDCPAHAARPLNGSTAISGEQVDREVYFRQPSYAVRGDSCGVVTDNRYRQRYSDSSCSRYDTESSTVDEREMDAAPRRGSGRRRRRAFRRREERKNSWMKPEKFNGQGSFESFLYSSPAPGFSLHDRIPVSSYRISSR